MSDGNVKHAEPATTVLWLGSSQSDSCNCETDACPYINFFSSAEHAKEWKSKNPNELGMILGLGESVELARRGWWDPVLIAIENPSLIELERQG